MAVLPEGFFSLDSAVQLAYFANRTAEAEAKAKAKAAEAKAKAAEAKAKAAEAEAKAKVRLAEIELERDKLKFSRHSLGKKDAVFLFYLMHNADILELS